MRRFLLAPLLWLVCASAWATGIGLDPNANSSVFTNATSGTTISGGIKTTNANDCIIAIADTMPGATATIADGNSLTWTARTGSPWEISAGHYVYEWSTVSSSAISSTDTVTVTSTSGSITASNLMVFAVSGCTHSGTSVTFDSGGPTFENTGGGNGSITTANTQSDFIFAQSSLQSTTLSNALSLSFMYAQNSSGLEGAVVTGAQTIIGKWTGSANDVLMDAVQGTTAAPGIQTPIKISTDEDGSATDNLVTDVDAPIGSLIIIEMVQDTGANDNVTGVTDSAGNTYSQAIQYNPASTGSIAIYYSITTHDLPSGGYLVYTTTNSTKYWHQIFSVQGATGGVDQTNEGYNFSTSVSGQTTTSGTLAVPNEIVFGNMASATLSTYASNFTQYGGFVVGESGVFFDYQIVNSTASVSWSPTWTPSIVGWVGVLATFKVTPAGAVTVCTISTMGAGPC